MCKIHKRESLNRRFWKQNAKGTEKEKEIEITFPNFVKAYFSYQKIQLQPTPRKHLVFVFPCVEKYLVEINISGFIWNIKQATQ